MRLERLTVSKYYSEPYKPDAEFTTILHQAQFDRLLREEVEFERMLREEAEARQRRLKESQGKID